MVTVDDMLSAGWEETDLVEKSAHLKLVTQQPGFAKLPLAVQSAVKSRQYRLETWPADTRGSLVSSGDRPAGEAPLRIPMDTGERLAMILRRCPELSSKGPQAYKPMSPISGNEMSALQRRYRFQYQGEYGVNHFQVPYWAEYDKHLGQILIADIEKGTIESLEPDGTLVEARATGLAKPRGFIFYNQTDLLVCCHQSGKIMQVSPKGVKGVFLDLHANAAELGPYLHPMIIQRIGQALFFLLSTADMRKRKVFVREEGNWSEIPIEGMIVNYMRAHSQALFFNDLTSGRLFKYDHRDRNVTRIDLEPFQGAYYAFCFYRGALYHLFNSQHLAIVKSTVSGQTVFRSIDCVAAGMPVAHILSLQAVTMAGNTSLLLSDAGRKSIHLIAI